jgi:hypothetical protein
LAPAKSAAAISTSGNQGEEAAPDPRNCRKFVRSGSGTGSTILSSLIAGGFVSCRREFYRNDLRDSMNRLSALLLMIISSAAIAQTTGTLNPSPTPVEPSVKQDVPPGGCMPIGMTASGEMVFPIQCTEIIERERGRTVEQKPTISEENATAKSEAPGSSNPVIKRVETIPLPKRRDAKRSDDGCQHYRSYNRASGTYTDYDGRRRPCR